jgi:hypothetical protein
MSLNALSRNQKLALFGCGGLLAALLFLVLLALAGYGFVAHRQAAAIAQVLVQDHKTGQSVSSVAQIVRNMEAIDLSKCPARFREAYLNHITAWEEMAEVEAEAQQWQQNYNSMAAMTESFLRGMALDNSMPGEADAARSKLYDLNRKAAEDIRTTFNQVQLIAEDYGASVTR